ncbi:MAG: SH3 domain-containing C40 family peptidase, partial [Acidobacteriota bacterium]|nr:SH3 domain-containing C40 family peptidase [Acidobacteriota bacterium]
MRDRRFLAAALLLFSFAEISLFAFPATAPEPPKTAVVVLAVQDLFVRPDETSSVDDQVILGDRVEILEDAAGFAKIRTRAGEIAWIPERALRRSAGADAPAMNLARVTSNFAHVYASPSFTKQKPLLTAPVGATLGFSEFLEGEAGNPYSWVRISLPDGRIGFVASRDVSLFPFKENLPLSLPLKSPSDWLALGKRFLGAPYTWGGTTPLGFDCSGLMARILSEHGVTLKRNSYEHAFQDPQLVAVAFDKLRPGDLLFFGTEDKIDHEAMWVGDGTVLQSTRHNVPGVQITPFDSPFLKPLFRYARRLKREEKKIFLEGEEGMGPRFDAAKAATLRATLDS